MMYVNTFIKHIFVILLMFSLTGCFSSDPSTSVSSSDGDSGSSDGDSDGSASFELPNVTFAASASRTSGVAPLGVFFVAGFSSSTESDRPFHDLEYSWDFGDTTNDFWAIDDSTSSTRSKNLSKGPVAAHVFETDGVKTVTLEVSDTSGVISTETFTITVDAANDTYPGTNTYCIRANTSLDFSGCPAGADERTVTDLTDIDGYIESGRRILLRRGDTWDLEEPIGYYSGVNGVTIGAFGTCNSPDARGICSNAPVIRLNKGAADDGSIFTFNNSSDWRIQDINFEGRDPDDRPYFSPIGGNTNISSILFLRSKVTQIKRGVSFSYYNTDGHDQLMVVDCDISNTELHVLYLGSERLVIMGNSLKNSDKSHVIRTWQSYLGVISHNNVHGADLTNGMLHALKFHGPRVDIVGCSESGCLENTTRFNVISGNIFGSSGTWPISIGPQNDDNDERINDLIFEKNRSIADYPIALTVNPLSVALHISAGDVTVRNNIFDGEGSENLYGYRGIEVMQRGIEPAPFRVNIYNNTIHKIDGADDDQFEGIVIRSEVTESSVVNNLVTFRPTASNKTELADEASDTYQGSNLLLDSPNLQDPTNATPLLRDFSFAGASTAINGGESILIYDDFDYNARPIGTNNYDVGAFED